MTDSSRPSLPSPSDADSSPSAESSSPPPTSLDAAQDDIPEPFREAVSALREQAHTAAETIRALRAENERLREKVDELSQRPDVTDEDAFVEFDDDREALRQRIQHFIDAIDDHLDNAPESGVASEDTNPLAFDLPKDESTGDASTAESASSESATSESATESESGPVYSEAGRSTEDDASDKHAQAEDAAETGRNGTVQFTEAESTEPELSEAQSEEAQQEDVPSDETSPSSPSSEDAEEEPHHAVDPLADGLPDAAQFEVEVPDDIETLPAADASGDEGADALDGSAESSDIAPSDEPLLIAPGLSPRRSARRSARNRRR